MCLYTGIFVVGSLGIAAFVYSDLQEVMAPNNMNLHNNSLRRLLGVLAWWSSSGTLDASKFLVYLGLLLGARELYNRAVGWITLIYMCIIVSIIFCYTYVLGCLWASVSSCSRWDYTRDPATYSYCDWVGLGSHGAGRDYIAYSMVPQNIVVSATTAPCYTSCYVYDGCVYCTIYIMGVCVVLIYVHLFMRI